MVNTIKSDIFYAAFAAGFASQKTSPLISKRRGKIPKYYAVFGDDELSFWFKVNPKASASPFYPGEFWPVIETKNLRRDQRDDGLVSWYQYTDQSINEEMKAFQWSVYAKAEAQCSALLSLIRRAIEDGFEVGWPHTALYYVDARDAEFWGKLFAVHLLPWMERFCANPETLEGYMWRVHWSGSANSADPSKSG